MVTQKVSVHEIKQYDKQSWIYTKHSAVRVYRGQAQNNVFIKKTQNTIDGNEVTTI